MPRKVRNKDFATIKPWDNRKCNMLLEEIRGGGKKEEIPFFVSSRRKGV